MLSRALSLATVTLLVGCLTAGALRGRKPGGRQDPFPDFRGHLQRLPQEPPRPVEDRAGVVAARLPAPALHHQQRHGLGAGLVPDLERRDRHALSEQGSAEDRCGQGRQARGCQAGSARPIRPPAKSRRRRRRRPGRTPTGSRRKRPPGRDGKRRPGPDARCRQARRWPDAGAGRDRQQNGRQAEARQARQAWPKSRRNPTRRPRKKPSAKPPRWMPAKSRGRKAGESRQAGWRGQVRAGKPDAAKPERQVRDRQGRCTQGNRWQRTDAAAARSGPAGHARAAGLRSDRQRYIRTGRDRRSQPRSEPVGARRTACAGHAARGDGVCAASTAAGCAGGAARTAHFPVSRATADCSPPSLA